MSKVTVLGRWWLKWHCSFKILYGNGHDVTIWSALQKEVDLLKAKIEKIK